VYVRLTGNGKRQTGTGVKTGNGNKVCTCLPTTGGRPKKSKAATSAVIHIRLGQRIREGAAEKWARNTVWLSIAVRAGCPTCLCVCVEARGAATDKKRWGKKRDRNTGQPCINIL